MFSVCLSFSLSLFWPPSFSVSLSLSLSFLLFFLSSFLSFLFAFFWFLVFVSFFLSHSSLLFFHERNNIKILNCKFCVHQYVLFFGFPVFFFVSSSFFLSLLFPGFKLCFFVQHQGFGFPNRQLKKTKWSKGGLQQNGFLSTCVLEYLKSYRLFCPFFWQVLVDVKKAL